MYFFRVQALLLSAYQGLMLAGITAPLSQVNDLRLVAALATLQTALALFSVATIAYALSITNLRTFGRWVVALACGSFGAVIAFGLSQLACAGLGVRGTVIASVISIGATALAFVIAAFNTCMTFQHHRLSDTTKNPLESGRRVGTQSLAIIFMFAAPLCMNVGGLGIKSLGDRMFHPISMLIAIIVIWGFATELDEQYNQMAT